MNNEQQNVQNQEHLFYNYFIKYFISVYYVNLKDCSLNVCTRTKYLDEKYPTLNNYLTSITEYINKDVHPEDREKLLKIVQPNYLKERLKKEQDFSVVIRDISDNKEKYYRFQAIRGVDEEHAAFGFIDITNEIRDKQQFMEVKEKINTYHDTLIKASSGYLEVNLSKDKIIGNIIDIDENGNERIVKIPNYDKECISYNDFEKWWAENMTMSDKKQFLKYSNTDFLISQYNSGRKIYEVTCASKGISKEIRYSRQTYYMSKDSVTGDIIAFCLVSDITKQKEELQKALELAQNASKAKSIFLFNMSHDIRTPMNAIIGFNDLALEFIDNKEILKDCLEKVKSSSKYLMNIINDVLDVARIEYGKVNLEKQNCSILEILKELEDMFEQLRKSNNITINVNLNIVHNYVYIDKVHFSRILMNIVNNSIKYTKSGGNISIIVNEKQSSKQDYAIYEFIIKDNGVGMSKEFLPRIFDSFSREQKSSLSKIQGTGLGMAITKELVDLMQGNIDIKSEVDVGTVVTLTFEFKLISENDFVDEKNKINNINLLSNKKILLVEDNELNRELTMNFLNKFNMKVDEATNGQVAVEKCAKVIANGKNYFYDFILMDIQMPVMDGFVATKKIRELFKETSYHVPIIAMTANAFSEDRKKAIESGMDEYISKPINVEKFSQILIKFIK